MKNPATWVVNDFDQWGRGEGVGVVQGAMPGFEDILDVKWPSGKCFEEPEHLLLVEPEEKKKPYDVTQEDWWPSVCY